VLYREEEAKRIYEETRSKVRDIYRSWNTSINEVGDSSLSIYCDS